MGGTKEELVARLRQHKGYRCIDRRFDGPKHLRTRDFGDEDDWF